MRVITATRQTFERLWCRTQSNSATHQSVALLHQLQLSFRNSRHCRSVKRSERHDVIDAIKDLRTQKLLHCSSEVFLRRAIRIAQALIVIFPAGIKTCARTSKLCGAEV